MQTNSRGRPPAVYCMPNVASSTCSTRGAVVMEWLGVYSPAQLAGTAAVVFDTATVPTVHLLEENTG